LKYVFLVIISFILLFPIYWMIIGGFQDIQGLMRMPPNWWPKHPTLENYRNLADYPLIRWSLNSLKVTVIAMILSLLVTFLSGYAFAFFRFRGSQILFLLFMLAIMIPRPMLTVPTFITAKKLGILGTPFAPVFPLIFSPVYIFVMRNFMREIPRDYLESARLDGAKEMKILLKIVLPLCKPPIALSAFMVGFIALSDYLWQTIVLKRDEMKTLLVGVFQVTAGQVGIMNRINPIGLRLAAGTLIFIPMFVLFLVCQKYLIRGVATTGIKY